MDRSKNDLKTGWKILLLNNPEACIMKFFNLFCIGRPLSSDNLKIVRLNRPSVFLLGILIIFIIDFTGCTGSDKSDDKSSYSQEKALSEREKPEIVYDKNGNITERHSINYRSDNTVRSIENYYYKYDDRNNLIEEIKESLNPQAELVFRNKNHYVYNELNQKTEQNFFSYDAENRLQQQVRKSFRYDKNSNIIEEKTYYPGGEVKSVMYTERTDKGLLKSEEYIYFDVKGIKTGHKKYTYNPHGLEKTEDLMNK